MTVFTFADNLLPTTEASWMFSTRLHLRPRSARQLYGIPGVAGTCFAHGPISRIIVSAVLLGNGRDPHHHELSSAHHSLCTTAVGAGVNPWHSPTTASAEWPNFRRTRPHPKEVTLASAIGKHRSQAVCAGCHRVLDPPGFSLDNFDSIGQWRDTKERQTELIPAASLRIYELFMARRNSAKSSFMTRTNSFHPRVLSRLLLG